MGRGEVASTASMPTRRRGRRVAQPDVLGARSTGGRPVVVSSAACCTSVLSSFENRTVESRCRRPRAWCGRAARARRCARRQKVQHQLDIRARRETCGVIGVSKGKTCTSHTRLKGRAPDSKVGRGGLPSGWFGEGGERSASKRLRRNAIELVAKRLDEGGVPPPFGPGWDPFAASVLGRSCRPSSGPRAPRIHLVEWDGR